MIGDGVNIFIGKTGSGKTSELVSKVSPFIVARKRVLLIGSEMRPESMQTRIELACGGVCDKTLFTYAMCNRKDFTMFENILENLNGFDVLAIDDVFNDKDIEYIQRLFLKYKVPIFVTFRTAILY